MRSRDVLVSRRAAEFEQVGLFLDKNRREPSLKEMPRPMVPAVVRLGTAPIQLPHAQ